MILSQAEIKRAANELLEEATGLKIYGREITEGYDTPSLFIEIVPGPFRRQTRNFAKSGFSLKITYFQDAPRESEQLELVDTIKAAFGMVFAVGDRNLTVGEITYDYVGQKEDILQISVDFEYLENTSICPQEELAEEMDFNLVKKKKEALHERVEGTGN